MRIVPETEKKHPKPRRHHFVPRFWLAGFTKHGSADDILHVTDYELKKQWQSSPANSGHRRDFNRLHDSAPDPLAMETLYGKLEEWTAPIFQALDRERRAPIPDELDGILTFMAYQFIRVPAFRPFAFSVMDLNVRRRLTESLASPEHWATEIERQKIDPDSPGASYEEAKKLWLCAGM